ncbi:amidohydrolase family protein [Clostridiales bacterium COT073_COT-073]|nr:amidohydrolase family protein [Clostridiales bacterium COT073_COT-073]
MKRYFRGKWMYTANARDEVMENFILVEEDGKITDIRPDDGKIPPEGEVIDVRDYYLIPGLIDCHVHFFIGPDCAAFPQSSCRIADMICEGAANAEKLYKAGIVACRDLGAVGGYTLGLRDAINRGIVRGPKILACGHAICVTGGHGHELCYEIDGADRMRQAVHQTIKDGADVIKLMASGGVNSPGPEPGPCELTAAEVKAGIETAHSMGRKVAAHAHGETAMRLCIEAGVDSIEHGVFMTEAIMEQMIAKDVFLVPTLCAPYYAVTEGIRREPDNPDHKKSQEILERHRQVLKRCSEKGVKIAMGTDAGCPFNPYEKAAHEIVLMVRAGLSPQAALKAATAGGAELMGLDDLGALETGRRATFICLKENPFEQIETVDQIAKLYADGQSVCLD